MSARTYNLRVCPGTRMATQSRQIIDESPQVETIILPREALLHVVGLAPSARSTIHIAMWWLQEPPHVAGRGQQCL